MALDGNTSTSEPCYPRIRPGCQARKRARTIVTWEVWTAICSMAASATLAIDLLQHGHVSWSAYPLLSTGVVWVYINIALFLLHRPWLATLAWFGTTTAFVGTINLIAGPLSWFVPLGLPLTMLAGAAVALALLICQRFKAVRPIIAGLLVLTAALCVGVDFTVGRFLGDPGIGWSIVVSAAILPLELLLALDMIYLRKRIDLRCYFHV
jgi:hypothetical protein